MIQYTRKQNREKETEDHLDTWVIPMLNNQMQVVKPLLILLKEIFGIVEKKLQILSKKCQSIKSVK